MYIIVDAYNLLKTVCRTSGDIGAFERNKFITTLRAYASRKKHRIMVVFDGHDRHDDGFNNHEKAGNLVSVQYAGYESADDVIEKLLEEFKGKDAILVSSDRMLNLSAERKNIFSIDSVVFYSIVRDVVAPQSNAIVQTAVVTKLSVGSDPELDQLMHNAAILKTLNKKDVHDTAASFLEKNTCKQSDRKLLKILKKLY
jgi:predicted RNA-binding protein with PIN domain